MGVVGGVQKSTVRGATVVHFFLHRVSLYTCESKGHLIEGVYNISPPIHENLFFYYFKAKTVVAIKKTNSIIMILKCIIFNSISVFLFCYGYELNASGIRPYVFHYLKRESYCKKG